MDETVINATAERVRPWLRQGAWFLAVGVGSTIVNAAIYLLLRQWWDLVTANVAALALSTLASSEANRLLTFAGFDTHRASLNVQSVLVFLFYGFYNTATVATLRLLVPDVTPQTEALVLLLVSGLGGTGRFLLLRLWVFRTPDHEGGS